MDRREAVKHISILLGGTFVGGTAILSGCNSETGKPMAWDENEIAYLDEIAETILPQTSTPGARAARVGDLMKVMVNDCYEEADQKIFRAGMDAINEASRKKYSQAFMELDAEKRRLLLIDIDKESKEYQEKNKQINDQENIKEKEERLKGRSYEKKKTHSHYFSMMKQLTLLGYFTSEIGAKQALRYTPVPGRYEGCIPYKKGDKAFA